MLYRPTFGNFWCPVVTLVTFSSILRNFEMNPKNLKKIQKISKQFQNPKIQKSKIQKKNIYIYIYIYIYIKFLKKKKNRQKKFKNGQKIWKSQKIFFFLFLPRKKSMLSSLVFQFKEDAIQTELSSPARFKIQGGSTNLTDRGGGEGRRKSLCLI